MSFLLGKDWNVLTITFERADLYRINGNRTKGRDANKIRDNAKRHARTIYWGIFNQKGKLLDGGPGAYGTMIPAAALERLGREWTTNAAIVEVLEQLQRGESDKAAKIFSWGDKAETPPPTTAPPKPAAIKPAATKPAAAPPGELPRDTASVYKLVIASDEGAEFESTLKLMKQAGQLTGTLLSPDGEEAPIEHALLDGSALSFDFSLGAGEETLSLKFQGTIEKDRVLGKLS
ncbi:MAG TPA: hypothetical protein VGN42_20670 [Pirellulales bacterium]|jgi:hypothetical protein|nr:hypothetical protein [Pirellulales bacterium]